MSAPASDAAKRLLPGAELCVHCGFCLQACPTYLALDDENDSPRGRTPAPPVHPHTTAVHTTRL